MSKVTIDFSAAIEPPPPPMPRAWSTQQDAIFAWFASGRGNLVVRARAGTGKTTTILEGVERAPERQILLAAFNKAIALELAARIRNPRVEAKTLHGLGFKYIRRNWSTVKVEERDASPNRAERLVEATCPTAPDPVKRIVRDLHSKARELMPFAASGKELEAIAVQHNLIPDEEWEEEGWGLRKVCDCAYSAMQHAKARTETIDFADMIFLPLVHCWVRPWFDLVVVDEAQDMTIPQLLIATGACRRSGRICVVGDDRQAIYAFRGADSESLDRLRDELGALELGLTVTYRCGSLIVDLAKTIVPDYSAAPNAPLGEIKRCDDVSLLDLALEGDFIISRTNAPLVPLCMALLKLGRRARIRGRDIGKGIVTLIRKLKARTIADVAPKLEKYVTRELKRAEKMTEKARESREGFIRDQQAIISGLCEGAATIAELEARCEELFTDDVSRSSVMLSTVHKVKGLETERTFLLESTFRSGKTEEDNIRYVAITRAKHTLTWVT